MEHFNFVDVMMRQLVKSFLCLLCMVVPNIYAYKSKSDCRAQLPKEFDYIVVGAGASGATVAARLSEDPDVTVCLVEAGIKDTDIPFESSITTPRLWPSLAPAQITWNTTTVPQRELNGRILNNGMGKVLGGSTTHNGMVYFRGYKADYDYWAANGAPGWDYNSVLPYFLKSENMTIPELRNSHDASADRWFNHAEGVLNTVLVFNVDGTVCTFVCFTKQYFAALHSTCGPLTLSRNPSLFQTSLWKLWAKTAKEFSISIGECNGPSVFGMCAIQSTLKDGRRESTARAFLKPANGRRNLYIITEAMVGKILITRKQKKAYGIRYIRYGHTYTIRARCEVIVSAGTYESPKLLQLSGIGPKSVLRKLKIRPCLYAPVGENIQDHIILAIDIEGNIPAVTLENLTDPNVLSEYIFKQTGLYAEQIVSINLFIDLVKQRHNWPEIQVIVFDTRMEEFISNDDIQSGIIMNRRGNRVKTNGISLMVFLAHPKSRGTVRPRSLNPTDTPLIDPKYLSHPDDIRLFIQGIRKLQEILRSPSMKKLGAKLRVRDPGSFDQQSAERCYNITRYDSNAFWRCVLRQQASVGLHNVRGCPIGDSNDQYAVVDQHLRVRGIKGLRVVDASVMPEISSANTQGPSIMIGEKGADIIKKTWSKKSDKDLK